MLLPPAIVERRILGAVVGATITLCSARADVPPEASSDPAESSATTTVSPASSARNAEAFRSEWPEGFTSVIAPVRAVDIAAPRTATLESLDVVLGQRVACGARIAGLETGALLLELSSARAAHTEALAEVAATTVMLEKAEYVHDSLERLHASTTEKERREASFDRQIAHEQLRRAEARVQLQMCEIRRLEDLVARSDVLAPFDGQVAVCYQTAGATLQQGTPIIRLIASNELVVRFAAPAQAMDRVRHGSTVCFEPAGPGDPIEAVVRHISPEIDPALEMLIVEAEFAPGGRAPHTVIPGLAGTVTPQPCWP